MRERIILFFKTYLLFVVIFIIQKPLFMAYYHAQYAEVSWTEWLKVVWHGMPLDLSLAGYLTLIPGLLLMISAWALPKILKRIWAGYFIFVSCLISLIFVVDLGLYSFWGFRLDATPLFYFLSSPKDAFASVSIGFVLSGILAFVLMVALLYWLFQKILFSIGESSQFKLPYHSLSVSGALLLLTGVLFIPIRGGFTVSTMNTGKVYYSTNVLLNHAATNPAFNLMESLSKQKDFASQYRFMEPAEADKLMTSLIDPTVVAAMECRPDTLPQPSIKLFRESHPDICLVILEGFSSKLMTALGGAPDIAVQLDSLSHEGILFTNFHANSFRTDRGLVAILSGYPAQPTTSIMKYPLKTSKLPAISRRLRQAGYGTHYYYGGDADFTNMRSYLMASGMEDIVCDKDFPIGERLSKWGVHDHLVFRRLLDDLKNDSMNVGAHRKPMYRVIQTSSSHEPFEVPYRRLEDDRMNAFAYTDSCVGDFVRQFKELPQWKNTVLIFVPDHLGATVEPLSLYALDRFQIPMLMIGGAVNQPRKIDVYGSQQDLAATLLAQLGLPHYEFVFSKDMLDSTAPHFAFFTVPDAFGMATSDNQLIFDNQASQVVLDEGTEKGRHLSAGKAYLQKLYDDLAARGSK